MPIIKPISISLSPNTKWDDIWLALKLVFQCWRWKRGRATGELEEEFKKYLGVKHAVSFNSGRTALMAILKSLELSPVREDFSNGVSSQDEVLVQAFTCNAAVNPVLWSGAKLVYVDCDENTFNINIEDLKRKITPKSRVVMVQHTFGLPAKMDKILEVVRENNLILIEDCAHSLGAKFLSQKVGTFGKAAFFSFSRDKVISSVYGGMAVTNDDKLGAKLLEFQKSINYPNYFWIFQQLLHPILLNFIILPVYNLINLGKIFLILSQRLHILSKAVHWKEKRGRKPDYFPKKLPNALALLSLNQFKKLDKFNRHRREIADFYYENLKNSSFILPKKDNSIFLRFTVKHPKAHEIIYNLWHKQNILIGDWYTSPVAPNDTDLAKLQYKMGSCPKAEKLSKITLNLPTHINISKKQAGVLTRYLAML